MNEQFGRYLAVIAAIIAAVSALPLYMLFKSRRRKKRRKIDPINGGNASVFFDKAGNAVVIPYVKDRYGGGRATANVEYLRAPYKAGRLGGCVRRALKSCMNCEPCDTKQLIALLGAKDWADFAGGRRNVSVHFREGRGIILQSTRNKGDGVFEFCGRRQEKVLVPETADEALGRAVFELLHHCR